LAAVPPYQLSCGESIPESIVIGKDSKRYRLVDLLPSFKSDSAVVIVALSAT